MSHFPCCGHSSVNGGREWSAWRPSLPLLLRKDAAMSDLGKKGDSRDYFLSLQGEKGTETRKKMRGNEMEREKDKEQEKAQGGGTVRGKGKDNEGRKV